MIRIDRRFRVLWCARTVSFLGDSLGLVALMLHVADQTGQAFAVAMLLLASEVAPALFGPLAGALSDRFDLRRIMVGCELAQAVLTVLIALWLPTVAMLLTLVAVRALAAQVFAPASRTAVPMLVAGPRLAAANATLGLGTHGAEVAGPLLAAVLLPPLGVRGVLLVDAVSFGLSTVLLATLPALRRSVPATSPAGPALRRATRDGLSYLRRAPVARAVVLGTFAVVACNGVDDVALVFLVRDSLGGRVARRGGHRAAGRLLATRVAPGCRCADGGAAGRRVRGEQRGEPAHRAGLGGGGGVRGADRPRSGHRGDGCGYHDAAAALGAR